MGPTTVSPKKRNLLDMIAGRKSRKEPKPTTDKDRYEKTRKELDSRVREAKGAGQYRTMLEGLEKEAKQQAKQGRHEDALKTLNKLEVVTARALNPELAGTVDLLGRDLAAFHELAIKENVKLPPPDDLKTQFKAISDLVDANNVSGAQRLLTRFKEGVEEARQALTEVRMELEGFTEPPPSLQTSYDAVRNALDEGDSVKAREAINAYAVERQKLSTELFQKVSSLGPPPHDLVTQHGAVLKDLEDDKLGTAVTGLTEYEQRFTEFEKERSKLELELSGLGQAPKNLTAQHNRIAAALEKGQLDGVSDDLNAYKKDLEKLESLRQEHASLKKPPEAHAEAYAAIVGLIDQGSISDAERAIAAYRKAIEELTQLSNEFGAVGWLPVDLAEQHMKVSDLLEAGDTAEARKALDTYKQDREKNLQERELLRKEAAGLPTQTGKDLARALQDVFIKARGGSLEEARDSLGAYKLAIVSHKEEQEKLRTEMLKLIEETKKTLPEGVDELPSDLALAQATILARIEEGSLEAARAALKNYGKVQEDAGKPERYTKRRAKVGERLENARSSLTIGPKIKSGLEFADGQAGGETPNYVGALGHLDKTLLLLNQRVKEIKQALNALVDRGLNVEAFMARKTKDWSDLVTKGLPKTDADWLKKVEEDLDKFRLDVEQAELKHKAQAPRSPTDLSNLQSVRDQYTRGVGSSSNRSEFARNTEQSRSVATQIITPTGQVDFGYLSMLPFGGDSSVSLLRYEVESGPEGGTSQSRHMSRMLTRLETDKDLRDAIEKVKAPSRDNFPPERVADYDRVCDMIRASLGLPKDTVITDVHARQAAVSALLTEIRQVEVGSCFGTSVAIQVQKNQPTRLVKDLQDLFTTGQLERTITRSGTAKTIRIPLNRDMAHGELTSKHVLGAPGANLHSTPQFSAALDALGVGETDKQAVLDAAQQDLRNRQLAEGALAKLPSSVSPEIRRQMLDEVLSRVKAGTVGSVKQGLQAVMQERSISGIGKVQVELELRALKTKDYNATSEELLAQVVRNRATGPLTDEQVQIATQPGKTAFLAQRDNRLLRAWEYTVASGSALVPEDPYHRILTGGTKDTMLGLVNSSLNAGKVGLNPTETTRLRDTCVLMRDEVNRLIEANTQLNYDASVSHVRPSDGQSSQGGWVLYYDGKKIENEEQYKAMMKDLIAKASVNVRNALPPGDPKAPHVDTAGNGMTSGVDDGGFMATALANAKPPNLGGAVLPQSFRDEVTQPWKAAAGGYSKQLLEVYYGQQVTTEKPTTTPTSEEDVVEWLIAKTRQMRTSLQDGVDLDPNNVFVPLSNGPHAYSFRPGSPFFQKDLKTSGTGTPPTGAELITAYKDKAKGRRTTTFPLNDPVDGMASKLIDGAVNSTNLSVDDVDSIKTRVTNKLRALGGTEVTAEQVKTAIEESIDEEFTDTSLPWVEYKTKRKAACKEGLGKVVQQEILAPVEEEDLDALLDGVFNKAAKHLSPSDRAAVTKTAKEALNSSGDLPASMMKLHKAVMDAVAALPAQDEKFGPRGPVASEDILAALKPEGPPGIVFAETNWGFGDGQILFSMIPDAFTDELQMWSVDESGAMNNRQDKASWVTASWELATDPTQYGGVSWGEPSPSGYESVP